ncbi:MAG: aldo/keto reductase [Anaerolineae bacterium]|nr:aldo/keto reductase [Anaerolineae bacterium]
MQYTNLGRAGLLVSKLCLGTMNFGPRTEEADSHRIMDRALDLGINFFDTANVYGWKLGEGITEQILGRWFEKDKRNRDKVVLATKVYNKMGEWPNEKGLSAMHIKKACEDSLRRMKTDYIDLYQMHHVDRRTSWEEIWQAMEQLVQEGKVIYVGSSNFAGWHIATANGAARQRNFLGLVCEQSLYNLTERTVELEVIPACEHFGLGLIPWSPLAGGILGGLAQAGSRRQDDWAKQRIAKYGRQLKRYEAFCETVGESPADVALAWLLHNPVVTAPIIGPRTLDQLEGSLHALEIKLNARQLAKLDEIWPGPGGPAPEAYAW